MATWKISNYEKKNAVEICYFLKDNVVIKMEQGYRWGNWTCESDERPDIDLKNEEGYEVFGDYDWEIWDMEDGCWVDWTFPNDMSEQERERFMEIWDNDYYEGLENEGWINYETEYWIFGPLLLTNEDTGESWNGRE